MKKFLYKHHTKFVIAVIMIILGAGLGVIISHNKIQSMKKIYPSSMVTQTIEKIDKENLVNGQWQYMPGVSRITDGFVVKPTHFVLSEQNASSFQTNSPINFAGTHLEKVTGDFKLSADIDLRTSKKATLQLYGKSPIIADEFRIERESVRIEIEKDKLTVSVWDGKNLAYAGQQPTLQKVFAFTPSDSINLTMTRQGGQLHFTINDRSMGEIAETGVFDTGTIWFGLDSLDGEWLFSRLEVKRVNGGNFEIIDSSELRITQHDPRGLQLLATQKRPDFIVGGAMAFSTLTTDPEYAHVALDKHMFGGMTPENDMKMINLQPQKGVYTFEKADALVHLATQNGLTVHGHTLVFGEANPAWFNGLSVQTSEEKKEIERIMKEHITTVVKHFGNKVTSWDVINEPMADYDDTADGEGAVLRYHKWYQAMGEEYIIMALETAHKANPEALLFINEYGLESEGDRWYAFVSLMTRLKQKLQEKHIPVEKVGVGFQAHVYEAEDRIDKNVLKQHIRQLGNLGYKTQISENDVYSDDGVSVQSGQYRDIFSTCLNETNCVAYRVWIISDRYNVWRDDAQNNRIMWGIDGLFDSGMKPRPAVEEIRIFYR